ncbi:MAG: HEAT repeat domain-containing protein [Planctomycetota bacterium]
MATPMLARPLALLIAAVAVLAAAPAHAIQGDRAADFVARDARVEFDRRSAAFARADIEDLEPGDHGRAAALVALGAAGSVEGRGRLMSEISRAADPKEQLAAIYALGELRAALGPGLETLVELTKDADPTVADAAIVALLRSGNDAGRSEVASIASRGGERAEAARSALAYQADPSRSELPLAFRDLYELRWDAARSYGLVDGEVWSSALLRELENDDVFLEALVLHLARDLELEGAKDHLLELLFEGENAQRVIAATRMMPREVESLVDAGVWRPADWKEWKWLVLTIMHDELQAMFPRTLALAVGQPVTTPMAAGLLHGREDGYEDLLLDAFRDEDPRNRAYAAYSVGASGSDDFIPRLEELCEDPIGWTRANAIGALIRMGSQRGVERALDVLAVPYAEREENIGSYLFEVLARAAPDREVMRFVEEVAPRLTGFDRAAADSILVLNGGLVDTETLLRELPLMNPTTPEAIRAARALGRRPGAKEQKLLARLFPREGAINMNLELAGALARSNHRSAEPLLQAAVWRLPWNVSVLAAAVVRRTYGERTLIAWAVDPPPSATDEDVRRLGYAIGEWGAMPAVEALRRTLGTTGGAELPALQGAVLGALASRTR